MTDGFLHTELTGTGKTVHRLGLSATYRPGRQTIHRAIDEGINFFFCFSIDTQMTKVMRDVFRQGREKYVIATGAYNLIWGHPNLRRSLEKRLRQLGTDYIDLFLFLGVTKGKQFSQRDREELYRLREEGKVLGVGMSSHDRKFAGELASRGALDSIMMRYNAAHRGAERDIFPYVQHDRTSLVSYTATRWTSLLRRPKSWPPEKPVPTAGMCYRFVLSNPHVDLCLTAPSNIRQFDENLREVCRGPLSEEEMSFMRSFGDTTYAATKKSWNNPIPFEVSH